MLWSAEKLRSFDCEATDHQVGRIAQYYFDAATWAIRFIAIDAGTGRAAHPLLVPPAAIRDITAPGQKIHLYLSSQALEQLPLPCLSAPATGVEAAVEYGLPLLWGCAAVRPVRPYPEVTARHCAEAVGEPAQPPLQSTSDVTGYRIHAADGLLGHVVDFLLEIPAWRIDYLAVSTHQWRPGKKILLPARMVKEFAWAPAWAEREIRTALPRQALVDAPAYHAGNELHPGRWERYFAQYALAGPG